MENIAIKVDNVSKIFKLPHEKNSSIKSAVINFYRRNRSYEMQKALNSVSFEIKKGEFFGIVGRNGSGKSTLLKLLAGIYTPTKGQIHVNGKLTPFIELGVGFNPELTGRENVFLNGALLGFNRKEMQGMYQDIVEFAELEKFMDQKLKNYSSGMQVRLAFSIAIRAESDILLIDEVLAVGDALFQQKCYDYFLQIKSSGKTVVFVSHDMGAIESFCDRAILIDNGVRVVEGKPSEVIFEYNEVLTTTTDQNYKKSKDDLQHIGVGGATITKAQLINSKGIPTRKINENEPFSIRIYYSAENELEEAVVGIGIMGERGESIIGPNTRDNKTMNPLPKNGYINAKFDSTPLATGNYRLRAGIFNKSVTIPYDFVEKLLTFNVVGKKRYGHLNIEPEWEVKALREKKS